MAELLQRLALLACIRDEIKLVMKKSLLESTQLEETLLVKKIEQKGLMIPAPVTISTIKIDRDVNLNSHGLITPRRLSHSLV